MVGEIGGPSMDDDLRRIVNRLKAAQGTIKAKPRQSSVQGGLVQQLSEIDAPATPLRNIVVDKLVPFVEQRFGHLRDEMGKPKPIKSAALVKGKRVDMNIRTIDRLTRAQTLAKSTFNAKDMAWVYGLSLEHLYKRLGRGSITVPQPRELVDNAPVWDKSVVEDALRCNFADENGIEKPTAPILSGPEDDLA